MKANYRVFSTIAAFLIGMSIFPRMGQAPAKVQAAEISAQTVSETATDREAQRKLDSAMGKMVLIEWKRVKSAEDLRACTSWTRMRLYYDFHSLYNQQTSSGNASDVAKQFYYNKGYLILDDSGDSSEQLEVKMEDVPSALYTNGNFAELYGTGQQRYGYIKYSGKDDKNNDGMPLCTISINPSRTGYLDVNSDAKLETNESWQDNWTVYPVSNGKQNLVKLFINLKNASDPTVRIKNDKDGRTFFYSNTKGYLGGYEEYTMYLGQATDVTVIQRDITVGEGQTVRISQSGAVALQAGVTLTIEEGGAAIIQSRFLNQGTIINHGTLIIMDGGSLQPIYDPGSGSVVCDGGDIVIMKGGRFMSSEALILQNGSSIVNQGIFLMKKSLTLDNATLITEEGGLTLLGYAIMPSDFASAAKTTGYDSETGKRGPALAGSSFYSVNSGSLNLKNASRLINRGETSIHQIVSSGNGGTIREESGTVYYWK